MTVDTATCLSRNAILARRTHVYSSASFMPPITARSPSTTAPSRWTRAAPARTRATQPLDGCRAGAREFVEQVACERLAGDARWIRVHHGRVRAAPSAPDGCAAPVSARLKSEAALGSPVMLSSKIRGCSALWTRWSALAKSLLGRSLLRGSQRELQLLGPQLASRVLWEASQQLAVVGCRLCPTVRSGVRACASF